jgi:hypothetical protein
VKVRVALIVAPGSFDFLFLDSGLLGGQTLKAYLGSKRSSRILRTLDYANYRDPG